LYVSFLKYHVHYELSFGFCGYSHPAQTAMDYCTQLNLGGHLGWRMPTIEELAYLIDMLNLGSIRLPLGHPFQNILPVGYWSSNTNADSTGYAWTVNVASGSPLNGGKAFGYYVWPVRGGQ
jgi:hypothetical protein